MPGPVPAARRVVPGANHSLPGKRTRGFAPQAIQRRRRFAETAEPAQLYGFGCPVLSAVGGQIGPGVARLGVGQGLLVPVRVARSWEAEDRPLPGRRPLDDLEPV